MLVGVFSQPVGSFSFWKGMGISLLVGSEPEADPSGRATVAQSEWRGRARAAGLPYYDRPGPDRGADGADPWLLGLMMEDEIDRRVISQALDRAKAIRATRPEEAERILRQLDEYLGGLAGQVADLRRAGKPIFCNFSGPHVTGALEWGYAGQNQRPLIRLADELAVDFYVRQSNYPNAWVGTALDCLSKWAGEEGKAGAPLWAFLECSDQGERAGPGPSVDDMEEQAQIAAGRGCKGIVWFPQSFGPGGFRYGYEPDARVGAGRLAKMAEITRRLAGPVPPLPRPRRTAEEILGEVGGLIDEWRAGIADCGLPSAD